VVQIALAKDPKLRFASMQAFANALEQASNSDQPPLEARTFNIPDPSSLLNGLADNATQPFSEEHSSQIVPDGHPQQLPILSAPQRPSWHPRLSGRIAILLVALALLVVAGGIGLIYYAAGPHPAQSRAQGATIAPTMLTANAQATAQTNTNAQATAAAFANAEAMVTATARHDLYIQATKGNPVIDDTLLYSNGNHWIEGTSSTGQRCAFTGGAYHDINPQPSYYPCFANATSFSNFAFQAQVTVIKGNEGGLVFLADQAHANYCVFELGSDGKYYFFCFINGAGTLGLASVSGPVGYKSPQPNLLTVIVRNNYVYLYVNKQYVAGIRETFLSSGEIGVFAEDDTMPTEAAFNNAQVWNL